MASVYHPAHLPRHRRYQLGLTAGVIFAALLDYAGHPGASHLGTLITIIWIWEQ